MFACLLACVLACVRAYLLVCLFACLFACLLAIFLAFLRVCLLVCLLACLFACVRACLLACLSACVLSCFHASWLACLHACLRACVRACLRACVRTCLCAYLRACLRACALAYLERMPPIGSALYYVRHDGRCCLYSFLILDLRTWWGQKIFSYIRGILFAQIIMCVPCSMRVYHLSTSYSSVSSFLRNVATFTALVRPFLSFCLFQPFIMIHLPFWVICLIQL